MRGIDVSLWQGDINWSLVKSSGVHFAMIKATEGNGYTDPFFDKNMDGASGVGIACGCYHYLRSLDKAGAVLEANDFCDAMDRHKEAVTLWAAVDVEDQAHANIGKEMLTDVVIAFLDRVRARGYKPMLYSNHNFITSCYDYKRLSHYPLWYACWYEGGENDKPVRDFDYKIWQQGVTRVSGIAGDVDNDYGYFDLPDEGDEIEPGDVVFVKPGSHYYGTDILVPEMVTSVPWIVSEVNGDRVLIDKSEDGTMAINSAVAADDLIKMYPPEDTAEPAEPEQPEDPTEEDPQSGQILPPDEPEYPDGKEDVGEQNGQQEPPETTQDGKDEDTGEKEDAEEEKAMENGLVSFFKMVLRALLIAIRSVFGKRKE